MALMLHDGLRCKDGLRTGTEGDPCCCVLCWNQYLSTWNCTDSVWSDVTVSATVSIEPSDPINEWFGTGCGRHRWQLYSDTPPDVPDLEEPEDCCNECCFILDKNSNIVCFSRSGMTLTYPKPTLPDASELGNFSQKAKAAFNSSTDTLLQVPREDDCLEFAAIGSTFTQNTVTDGGPEPFGPGVWSWRVYLRFSHGDGILVVAYLQIFNSGWVTTTSVFAQGGDPAGDFDSCNHILVPNYEYIDGGAGDYPDNSHDVIAGNNCCKKCDGTCKNGTSLADCECDDNLAPSSCPYTEETVPSIIIHLHVKVTKPDTSVCEEDYAIAMFAAAGPCHWDIPTDGLSGACGSFEGVIDFQLLDGAWVFTGTYDANAIEFPFELSSPVGCIPSGAVFPDFSSTLGGTTVEFSNIVVEIVTPP